MRYERVAMLAVVGTLAVWVVTCKSDNGGGPPTGGTPSVDVGADLRIQPSQTVSFTGRVAIPPSTNPTDYHWTLAWGDGATDNGAVGSDSMVTAAHSYAAVGQYALHLVAQGPNAADTASDTSTIYVYAPGTPQVLIGAGDIGECGKVHSARTAAVLDTIPGTVFTLGDNAYPNGRLSDFTRTDGPGCWANTWGRFKKQIHPTPGNHEFAQGDTTGAGYFGYFGIAAGRRPIGNYSYDLGGWHIIVLNSAFLESQALGRFLSIDKQLAWLSADLAAHPATCTLAMWHHPHFSSGPTHGDGLHPDETGPTKPFWDTLYAHGAELILSGHEHNYERFAPQTPDGVADPTNGIRQFDAGTGGGGYDTLATTPIANSEVSTTEHGLLKLTLTPGAYQWQFIPTSGPLGETDPSTFTFTDSGSGSCH